MKRGSLKAAAQYSLTMPLTTKDATTTLRIARESPSWIPNQKSSGMHARVETALSINAAVWVDTPARLTNAIASG